MASKNGQKLRARRKKRRNVKRRKQGNPQKLLPYQG